MSRRDDAAARGPKVLLLSAFRLRRLARAAPDRQRTSAHDRRSRQRLREASEAARAAYELFSRFAHEAEEGGLSEMFRLLGQMSLMQTEVLEDELKRSRGR